MLSLLNGTASPMQQLAFMWKEITGQGNKYDLEHYKKPFLFYISKLKNDNNNYLLPSDKLSEINKIFFKGNLENSAIQECSPEALYYLAKALYINKCVEKEEYIKMLETLEPLKTISKLHGKIDRQLFYLYANLYTQVVKDPNSTEISPYSAFKKACEYAEKASKSENTPKNQALARDLNDLNEAYNYRSKFSRVMKMATPLVILAAACFFIPTALPLAASIITLSHTIGMVLMGTLAAVNAVRIFFAYSDLKVGASNFKPSYSILVGSKGKEAPSARLEKANTILLENASHSRPTQISRPIWPLLFSKKPESKRPENPYTNANNLYRP